MRPVSATRVSTETCGARSTSTKEKKLTSPPSRRSFAKRSPSTVLASRNLRRKRSPSKNCKGMPGTGARAEACMVCRKELRPGEPLAWGLARERLHERCLDGLRARPAAEPAAPLRRHHDDALQDARHHGGRLLGDGGRRVERDGLHLLVRRPRTPRARVEDVHGRSRVAGRAQGERSERAARRARRQQDLAADLVLAAAVACRAEGRHGFAGAPHFYRKRRFARSSGGSRPRVTSLAST